MKKYTVGALIGVVILLTIASSEAVVSQVGAVGECDTELVGCRPVPVAAIMCANPSTCSRITASDPSNANLLYGTDSANCRKSTDAGATWANCTANPSTVTLLHYAVAVDGEVLAAGNGPGGTTFIIQRSSNGGTSWTNVYSSATVDGDGAAVFKQRIACATTTLICIAGYRSAGNQLIGLHSIDGGASWIETSMGTSLGTVVGVGINSAGTIGGVGIRSGDGALNYKGAIWNGSSWALSSVWPNTAGALCSSVFIRNADFAVFCKQTTAAEYTIRDYNGQIQSTFTIPNGFTGVPGSYIGHMLSMTEGSTAPALIFGLDTRVGTSVWVSIDGSTFFQTLLLSDIGSAINTPGSAYLAHGCGYFSANQGVNPTGTVVRAC